MRRVFGVVFTLFVVLYGPGRADTVDPSDNITLIGRTIYRDGNLAAPDSMRIIVTLDGVEMSDAWYDVYDDQCLATNNALVFSDQLQDIDGVGGDGHYLLEVGAYDGDSILYTWYYYDFTVGIYHSVNFSDINGQLDSVEIGTDAINHTKIATDAIGHLEIAANAISSGEIAPAAITSTQLAPSCLTSAQFNTGAITANAIATSAIDADAIATNAIGTSELDNGAIAAANIALNAFTYPILSAGFKDSLADWIWEYDTIGVTTLGMGYHLKELFDGISLDDNTYSLIGDTVWAASEALRIIDSLQAILDTIQSGFASRATIGDTARRGDEIYAEIQNIDGWRPITDDDSLIVDQSSLEDMTISSVTEITNGVTLAADAVDAPALSSDAIDELWEYAGSEVSSMSGIGVFLKDSVPNRIWSAVTPRELTAFDEDNTLIDLDGTSIGAANTVVNPISISAEEKGRIADSVVNREMTLKATEIAAIADTVWQSDTADHNGIANSYGQLLADESYVQGEASQLTVAQISDGVWDELASEHVLPGSFGQHLDAQVSAIGPGSGAYGVTVRTYDSAIGQVVPNSRVIIRNLSQTALLALGSTDVNGEAPFNLDADSFLVMATATGYLFEGADTLVVTGDDVDTIFGSRFDPGSPTLPGLCRVFGYIVDIQGQYEATATVSAYLPRGVAHSGSLVVSPYLVSTQTDTLGYFQIDLIPSDSLMGEDTRYEISIDRSDGSILRQRVSVPALTSWQLVW